MFLSATFNFLCLLQKNHLFLWTFFVFNIFIFWWHYVCRSNKINLPSHLTFFSLFLLLLLVCVPIIEFQPTQFVLRFFLFINFTIFFITHPVTRFPFQNLKSYPFHFPWISGKLKIKRFAKLIDVILLLN